ncbi:MAG: hypothetical protein MI748_21260 [Opitutales bacterium]|nr:hypothetical protein [Opitutales bacterium]
MKQPLLMVGKLSCSLEALGQTQTARILVWNQVNDFAGKDGFGWIQKPNRTYTHEEWKQSRPPSYTVAMMAPEMELGFQLAPGTWECLLVVDEGQLDLDGLSIYVGEESIDLRMHDFGHPAEPSLPMNRYRIVAHRIEATGELTRIRLVHTEANASLLAVYLLPVANVQTDREKWYLSRIEELGQLDCKISLDSILWEMASELQRGSANRSFYWYWLSHLRLIHEAEISYQQLGWDWVSEKTDSTIFDRFKQAISNLDFVVKSHPEREMLPIFDRVDWLRTRLLYWVWLEQRRANDWIEFERSIKSLVKRFPEHELVRMYSGELIPNVPLELPDTYSDAPPWAKNQYKALQRLREVAYYWIHERQISNGEMGGKPDDDVEMLRWWRILAFAGDKIVKEGYEKLANGMWFSGRVKDGYSLAPRDVEHSAEPIADTAPDMALMASDPLFVDRLVPSYQHMKNLWTDYNDRGFRQFKSAWIGSQNILETPPRNRDVSMNSRAVKALRYLYFLEPESELKKILLEWGDCWLDAAMREDKGKPKGLFPASLRFPDASFNGNEPTWYESNMFWHYFEWTGDARLYDHLLFCYRISGDPKYLEPMRMTLKLIQERVFQTSEIDDSKLIPGSEMWAANLLANTSDFWSVAEQWRIVEGDPEYDEHLMEHGSSFLKYWITKDTEPLANGIEEVILSKLDYNLPMRTTEVLFTDRVHVTQRGDYKDSAELLASMLTGSTVNNGTSPYMSHIWLEAPEGFTSLIDDFEPQKRSAWIFLHQDEAAEVKARVFQLPQGRYDINVWAGGEKQFYSIVESGGGAFVDFKCKIPGGVLTRLEVLAADFEVTNEN